MGTATRMGRLSALAVGLGIAAAVASWLGTAAAGDFQMSIDGLDLFPTAGRQRRRQRQSRYAGEKASK